MKIICSRHNDCNINNRKIYLCCISCRCCPITNKIKSKERNCQKQNRINRTPAKEAENKEDHGKKRYKLFTLGVVQIGNIHSEQNTDNRKGDINSFSDVAVRLFIFYIPVGINHHGNSRNQEKDIAGNVIPQPDCRTLIFTCHLVKCGRNNHPEFKNNYNRGKIQTRNCIRLFKIRTYIRRKLFKTKQFFYFY